MDHVIVLEDQSVVILIPVSFLVPLTVLVGEIVVACLQLFQQWHQNQLNQRTTNALKIKK
jgi:hypothetical protein